MAYEKEVLDLLNFMKEYKLDIDNLKLLITEASRENFSRKLSELDLYCNNNEQYNRNWSIRVYGIYIPMDLIRRHGLDAACMIQVYNRLIYPVLSKKLDVVPGCFELLSNGHFVGEAMNNKPRTVIIRFISRHMRNLFLGGKFNSLPKPTTAEVTMGIKYFAAYPDLTNRNHQYLMALKADGRTKSSWAFDGSLRFVLNGDPSENVNFVEDIRITASETIDKAVSLLEQSRGESPPGRRLTRASSGRERSGEDQRGRAQVRGRGRDGQGCVRGGGRGGRENDHGGHGNGRGGRGWPGNVRGGHANVRGGYEHGRSGHGNSRSGRGQGSVRGGVYRGAGGEVKLNKVSKVDEPLEAKYPEHSGLSQEPGPSRSIQDPIVQDQSQLPNDSDYNKSNFNSDSFDN